MKRRSTRSLLPIVALIALAAGCHDPPAAPDGGPLSDASWSPDAGTPTFTWLYDNVFHPWCSDRNQPCHNPGANMGVSFSTRDRAFGKEMAELNLPSMPKHLISVSDDPFRPQVRLDRDAEGGMSTVVGRLRSDPVLTNGVKYMLVSHNTRMGAARGAILVAEYLTKKGYIK